LSSATMPPNRSDRVRTLSKGCAGAAAGRTFRPPRRALDADDLDAVFDLPAIGCRLAMRDMYEGLTFDSPTPG